MRTLIFVRDRWPLLLIAAVCSMLAAIADSVREHGTVTLSPIYGMRTIVYLGLFIMLAFAGERLLNWLSVRQSIDTERGNRSFRLSYQSNIEQFLIVFTIILVCWLPYVLICFPGVVWYDTQQQLMQWFGQPNIFTDGSHLSDHHPVLDTAIFGLFTQFGGFLGSRDIGIFIYSVVQAMVTVSALTSVILFCRKIGFSHRACTFTLCFFALFPVLPMYSIGMVKDSVFMPFFIWFFILFVAIARSGGALLKRPQYLVLFVALGLCMSLTKKTGLYVVLLSCLILLFFLSKGNRIRAMVVIAIVGSIMMVLLPRLLFPILDIQPGGKQEMLAIPFQQSALLVKDHSHDISNEDLDAIYAVLGKDVGSRYQSWAADNVKGYSWDSRKDQYLRSYFVAWLRGGLRHPKTYISAYVALEEGWIGLPNGQDESRQNLLMPVYALGSNHVFTGSAELGLYDSGKQETVQDLENKINWLENTPLGMLLFSRAIWSTWMVAFVLYECLRHNRRRIAWLLPYATTFLFLWISPATVTIEGMRYLMPLVFTVPLAFAAILVSDDDQSYRGEGEETVIAH